MRTTKMPATITAVPQPEAKAREVKPIPNGRFWPMGYQHNLYTVVVPAGTRQEDLAGLNPPLWSVVCDKLRAFDMVHVVDEGDTFFAQVLVRSCDPAAGVELILMAYVPLPARNTSTRAVLPPDCEIEYVASLNVYQPWFTKPERIRAGEAQGNWEAARQILVSHARFRKS